MYVVNLYYNLQQIMNCGGVYVTYYIYEADIIES